MTLWPAIVIHVELLDTTGFGSSGQAGACPTGKPHQQLEPDGWQAFRGATNNGYRSSQGVERELPPFGGNEASFEV